MVHIMFISNTYSLCLFKELLNSFFTKESNVIIIYRDIRLVKSINCQVLGVNIFQYFECRNIIEKLKAKILSNNLINSIIGDKKYILYIPHSDSILFHLLKVHRNCIRYYYIEEGDVSLLDFTGNVNNFRKPSLSLFIDKLIGIKDDFRYFDVVNSKFDSYIGFFRPIQVFENRYSLIKRPTLLENNNIQFDALFFLDKTITGYQTDTQKEINTILNIILNRFKIKNLKIKPHPKTTKAGEIELSKIIKEQSFVNSVNIELLESYLTIDDILCYMNFRHIISGYSSVVLELAKYTDSLTILLSSKELSKYYGGEWLSYFNRLNDFKQRNKIENLTIDIEIF